MTAAANPLRDVSPRARNRRIRGKVMEALATLAALLAIVVLFVVVLSVAKRGLPALDVDFFTKVPAPFGQSGGGISNAIVGTIVMTLMATAMAVPVGTLIAIYNTEFAPRRVAEVVRLLLNTIAGIPTIVVGVFVFGFLVVGRGQSAFAASVALAIIMLPLIARATEEVLLLVPGSLREAGLALGATRARTSLTVVLPTAVGGIVTGTILAIARAAGETAPVLFTSSIVANAVTTNPRQPMGSIPLTIFVNSESPSAHDQQQAWAAALVLMAFVLLTGIAGRLLSRRTRRKIEMTR